MFGLISKLIIKYCDLPEQTVDLLILIIQNYNL